MPKTGDLRDDGRVYYAGRWLKPEDLSDYKEYKARKAREWKAKNLERSREMNRNAQRRRMLEPTYAERQRELARKRESDPAQKEKRRERSRRLYARDPKKHIERHLKWKRENREKVNAWNRRNYHENHEKIREYYNRYFKERYQNDPDFREKTQRLALDHWYRNNPTAGVKRTISEYRRGRVGLDEAFRLCRDAYDRASKLLDDIRPSKRKAIRNDGGSK